MQWSGNTPARHCADRNFHDRRKAKSTPCFVFASIDELWKEIRLFSLARGSDRHGQRKHVQRSRNLAKKKATFNFHHHHWLFFSEQNLIFGSCCARFFFSPKRFCFPKSPRLCMKRSLSCWFKASQFIAGSVAVASLGGAARPSHLLSLRLKSKRSHRCIARKKTQKHYEQGAAPKNTLLRNNSWVVLQKNSEFLWGLCPLKSQKRERVPPCFVHTLLCLFCPHHW